MQQDNVIQKLLLGFFFLLLSDRAISAPMTAQEQDQLMSQLSVQTDQLFNGQMNCPPYVAGDVKKCVMAESKKANDDVCVVMKNVWGCQKDGVLKCENGKDVWKFTAPILDNVAKSLGCPATNMDDAESQSGMTTSAGNHPSSKTSLASKNADQGISHALIIGLILWFVF